MNSGSIDCTVEEVFRRDQSMATIEEEAGEDFSFSSRKMELEILARLVWGLQMRLKAKLFQQPSPYQLTGSKEFCVVR
jgi:hypothetical protein